MAQAVEASPTTTAGMSHTFPTKTTTTALAVLAGLAANLGLARYRLTSAEHAAARELDTGGS